MSDITTERSACAGLSSVVFFLPSLIVGGSERVAIKLANEFDRRGLRVTMLLAFEEGAMRPALSPGVTVTCLGRRRLRSTILPLAAFLRRHRPDALIASMWPLPVLALAADAVSGRRTRVVAWEHTDLEAYGREISGPRLVAMRLGLRHVYPRAHAIVAVSSGAAASLAAQMGVGRDRVTVIYNPVTPLDAPDDESASVCPAWEAFDGARIISVGNLRGAKSFPLLLRAFASVRRHVAAKLLILGEGPERPSLLRLVDELGLGDSVFLPGQIANPYRYMKQANLYALSSSREGFSVSIVEALACGVPVVSTDCKSGPREILSDGRFGRLTPVDDPDAFAEALRETLSIGHHDAASLRRRAEDFSTAAAASSFIAAIGLAADGPSRDDRPEGA